ncbi:MAG: VWA domain-containing protein [Betaproteobacteria bacterium HGW-Betaproteobacteria-1]|jgi:mxaC protein|nr:MAG: VWA domain-containing protein [Betaproteobacteria bacterium HGW-Betaproteobacteria-1]
MSFVNPWVLWLLPLALLPLLLERSHNRSYSWVAMLPNDPLSNIIAIFLKLLAVIALTFILLGLASPQTPEQHVEKTGVGAQIALVLDRSASMDDPFSGAGIGGRVGETKSAAASRLITNFIRQRENDLVGLITFSNSAMHVLPLTENREAVVAAVQATADNALFQTNIGSGLSSGTSLFEKIPNSGSRAIILISDGAGRISADVQQKVRDWLDRMDIGLYWIVLKQPGGLSIFDETFVPKEDEPLPPVIALHEYFQTLKTSFHAYEADDPDSLAKAIADINQKEKKPIIYLEKIPGKNYTQHCFMLAALMIALLLGVKYLEVRTWHSA